MKIPGMGEVKTPYVVGGGVVLVGVLGYAYYRNKKQNAAATAAAATSDTAAATDVNGIGAGSSGIDPATGIPYADEEGGDTYGGIDPATGLPYYDEVTQSSTTTNPNAITTNQQWIQQAEADGQNLFGATYALSVQAVEDYISQTATGLPASEYQLIQSIVAELGPPPVGSFRLIQSNGPSGGTTTTTGTTTGSSTLANSVGKVVNIPTNIASFGSLAKTAAYFEESVAHLQAANPGLSATATTGAINIPYQIKAGDTLTSIAAKFKENPENVASVLSTQGVS